MTKPIEVKNDTGYGLVYRAVMRDKNLHYIAKSIYAYLCSFAGTSKEAFPSVSLIIGELQISKNTFHKYQKQLVECKIISVRQEKGESGKFDRNVYTILPYTTTPYTKRTATAQIDTNNNKSFIINNSNKKNKQKKEINKNIYGEFENVLLTDEELKKLKNDYKDYKERIENLSCYIESSGKKYKSHYATILNWSRKEIKTKGGGNFEYL